MILIERAARAIWNIRREDEDRCDVELEDLAHDHSVWGEARAAIAALMEPSEAMVTAGEEVEPFTCFGDRGGREFAGVDADSVWRAMLTAALKETPDAT